MAGFVGFLVAQIAHATALLPVVGPWRRPRLLRINHVAASEPYHNIRSSDVHDRDDATRNIRGDS